MLVVVTHIQDGREISWNVHETYSQQEQRME